MKTTGWRVSNGGPNHPLEHDMTRNVGGIDRLLRAVIGLTLIALAATGTVGWWGWLGIVPLITAAVGWCPPYSLLGWNTCGAKPTP
jgi:hypothetical protein